MPIDRYVTLDGGDRQSDSRPSVFVCRARAVVVSAVAGCCRSAGRDLLPAPLPDLSRVDAGVQAQVRGRYETLTRALADRADAPELASRSASTAWCCRPPSSTTSPSPCYLNAQKLAPDEVRWPYYLGEPLQEPRRDGQGRGGLQARAGAAARTICATLIWLGRLHLDQGRPEAAEPLFAKAIRLAPRTVAALAGLGRVAVAKRDYPQAVKYLEDALAIDPEAESLHAPLATAYRGLGQLDKAQPHLRQWRNRESAVPDPLQQDLDLLLESGLSYELRGVRAFEVARLERRRCSFSARASSCRTRTRRSADRCITSSAPRSI